MPSQHFCVLTSAEGATLRDRISATQQPLKSNVTGPVAVTVPVTRGVTIVTMA